MKLLAPVVLLVVASGPAVAAAQGTSAGTRPPPTQAAPPTTPKAPDTEDRVAELIAVVAELRRQVAELREEVARLRQEVRDRRGQPTPTAVPAQPLPDADQVARAIMRNEIIVGMTLREAQVAKEKWEYEVRETGERHQVVVFGEPYSAGGERKMDPKITVTLHDGRITRIVHHRRSNLRAEQVGGPLGVGR